MRMWFAGPRIGFIRPGVSFGSYGRSRQARARSQTAGRQKVYVIVGDHGMNKIGVSDDPDRRQRELQTGSAHELRVVWCTPVPTYSTAYEIEQEAHAMLDDRRRPGEWFEVSSNVAIAAVYGAAERLGVNLSDESDPDGARNWHERLMLDLKAIMSAIFIPRSIPGFLLRAWMFLAIATQVFHFD